MRSILALLGLLEVCTVGCAPNVTSLYESRETSTTLADGQKLTLGYRLLKPEPLEPGRKYPLVLFLHGAGERGSDNKLQLKYFPTWIASDANRTKFPCFVLVPQCPEDMKWSDVSWTDHSSMALGDSSGPMQAVVELLDTTLAQLPIDPDRVYLTGISMGGYGSWDLAERMPERFAAVAPVCGGGDEASADRLLGLPVWAWHGDEDKAVPVERSRRMIEAIKAAGGDPKYTELKGVGHDSWTAAYSGPDNVLGWLYEQRRDEKFKSE